LLAVAARVRAHGGVVAFDNNYRPRLWAHVQAARNAFAAATAAATLALMTLDDEQALWGEPDATTQLQHTLALATPEVVVKRGAMPTLVRGADGQVYEVPTERVVQVVDTTAAGDSFAGAYLAARLSGAPGAAAAAAGNRLAARVVQHQGAVIASAAMADLC
jgi:2-dehydro-3-deoxygluconokinase